jgi:hypothetical protein
MLLQVVVEWEAVAVDSQEAQAVAVVVTDKETHQLPQVQI